MTWYLGIDGGGTGCRAALTNTAGRVLGRAEGGPANIASDPEGALANLLAVAGAATRGIAPLSQIVAGLGLAGANAAGAAGRLAAALPFARARIVTDAITAPRGALGPRDGIVAAMGTGSVYGIQRGGRLRQIGGRGLAVGDEASGAWLGRNAMARALRAADGMEPPTPFLSALIARHGGDEAATGWTVTARPVDFARLAPEIAASDDPAARALIAEAVAQIDAAIAVLQEGVDLPVVTIGGLAQVYAPFLSRRWRIAPAAGSPLDGALALARGEIAESGA